VRRRICAFILSVPSCDWFAASSHELDENKRIDQEITKNDLLHDILPPFIKTVGTVSMGLPAL